MILAAEDSCLCPYQYGKGCALKHALPNSPMVRPLPRRLACRRRRSYRHDMRYSGVIHLLIQRWKFFFRNFLHLRRRFADEWRHFRQLVLLLPSWCCPEPIQVSQQSLDLLWQWFEASTQTVAPHSPVLRARAHTSPQPHPPFSAVPRRPFCISSGIFGASGLPASFFH